MKTEYIEEHFCERCLRETAHVLYTYLDRGSLTCQFCQHSEIVDGVGETMSDKQYTIVSIEEPDFNTKNRRVITVELLRTTPENRMGGTPKSTDTIKIKYPAYGSTHYTASMEGLGGGSINHVEAKAIAKEIRRFFGTKKEA